MLLQDDVTKLTVNISPYAEWRTSPMGLAGRDPIFFAQLQSETNALPEALKSTIENTCLHCHGVMGQREFSAATKHSKKPCKSLFVVKPDEKVPLGECFTLDKVSHWQDKNNNQDAKYGALARDGISCAICHRMQDPDNQLFENEKVYTGNFVTGPANEIYGPYKNSTIVTKPMEHALNITPSYSSLITQSDTCGSCHNILLPVFNNDGTQPDGYGDAKAASYEQTTHLEWLNSDAGQGDTFVSCQGCHMPNEYHNANGKTQELGRVEIANIQSADSAPTTESLPLADIKLTERDNFARHSLHGLNIFLNEMAQQFPIVLGLRQIDYMNGNTEPALITGNRSMVNMARQSTAKIEISKLQKDKKAGQLVADVKVTNYVGHFLPSGVGFRRVFIELMVKDKKGKVIWSSGRTNNLGVIVDSKDIPLPTEIGVNNQQYQPHYQMINSDSQVQIYQEVIVDSEQVITTSFLRRIKHLKDNRLRPKGYDPEFFKRNFDSVYIKALAETHGEAANDLDYTDPKLTGIDRLQYQIPLSREQLANVGEVSVRLFNQSIPPSYLQERFSDASKGKQEHSEIQRLYYITSHLNTNPKSKGADDSPIKDWKLLIAEDFAKTP